MVLIFIKAGTYVFIHQEQDQRTNKLCRESYNRTIKYQQT